MRVWTIKEGEPLPVENCPGRQMRCGIISEMLADRGHDVAWWTSDFFHQTKTRLKNEETVVDLRENYRLHMLHANTVYKKNISLERIRYSRQLGEAFRSAAKTQQKPDIIFCAFPLIDFAFEAVTFGKENNIPVVVDIRDLWPNIIWEHFPKLGQPLVKLLCNSQIKKTRYTIQNATAVIGVIPKCMEFAESYGRRIGSNDRVCYLAYREKPFQEANKQKSRDFWNKVGIKDDDFVICWIGQISTKRTDFYMVCDVIASMPECKFVVCGDGVSKKELEEKYRGNSNIIFPGFLNQEELEELMRLSKIGVIPIRNTPDFENTINNKSIEYMAGSLCIFTTLRGLLKDTIEKNEFGVYFDSTEDFKNKLFTVMNDAALLSKYKNNARKYYEANFNAQRVYGELCDSLEQMASQERKVK